MPITLRYCQSNFSQMGPPNTLNLHFNVCRAISARLSLCSRGTLCSAYRYITDACSQRRDRGAPSGRSAQGSGPDCIFFSLYLVIYQPTSFFCAFLFVYLLSRTNIIYIACKWTSEYGQIWIITASENPRLVYSSIDAYFIIFIIIDFSLWYNLICFQTFKKYFF